MPTVTRIIDIAKVSQMLAANQIQQNGLFGGVIDRRLPRLLYMERKAVERIYDLDSTDDALTKTANYVYALCGKFSLRAAYLIDSATGGTIPAVTDGSGDTVIWDNVMLSSADFTGANAYVN
jgi:hypothetical protein